MDKKLSVIICTHNPRRSYLSRVLSSLQSQTLSSDQWELLLIDNASDSVLALEIDLNWHPQARHIREENLGLTSARLRGIKESIFEVLVFVDDDNVLESNYLDLALKISQELPFLGAWGGQITGEFEQEPLEWAKPYLPLLGIREFEQDKWSNLPNQHETTPCGAGLCVRKKVAEKYAALILNDKRRMRLGRVGKQLMSCEDSDLAFTACDMNLGTGQFKALKLTHLIPADRLKEEYLLKLVESMHYSLVILDYLRSKEIPKLPKTTWRSRLLESYYLWKLNDKERLFHRAIHRGRSNAIQKLMIQNEEP